MTPQWPRVKRNPSHLDVVDVGRPDLVRLVERQLGQQTGMNPLPWCRLRRVPQAVDRIERLPIIRAGNPQPANPKAFLAL